MVLSMAPVLVDRSMQDLQIPLRMYAPVNSTPIIAQGGVDSEDRPGTPHHQELGNKAVQPGSPSEAIEVKISMPP
jgi:hypothetical protein